MKKTSAKRLRMMVAMGMMCVMILVSSTMAYAAISWTTKTISGASTTSSSTYSYATSDTITKKVLSTKYEYTHSLYKGTTSMIGPYALTGNYYHTKGQTDLSTSISVTKGYNFSVSVISSVKSVLSTNLGVEYSWSTQKSVTHTIASTASSGYYYYGVKCKTRDYKDIVTQKTYTKTDGSYVLTDTTKTTYYTRGLYTSSTDTGLYYAWTKQS